MKSPTIRLLSCWSSALAVSSLLAAGPALGQGQTIYVSPAGNDAWSGRLEGPNATATDGPLATLTRAQERVRELRAASATPVTVLLRGGTYRLSQSLTFTPADSGTAESPVTWAAYPNERPVISGGLPIVGWEADGRLWRTTVPKAPGGIPWRFNQLYGNGERRIRARTPNRGQFFRTDGPTSRNQNRGFYYHEGDLQEWDRLQDAMVVAYHSWETSLHHIRSVDPESQTVLLREQAPWPFGRWERQQRYYVENIFEGLDEPGEWYLNQGTGVIHYFPLPGETPENVELVAPVVSATLLEFAGEPTNDRYVEHLHFRGIEFRHTNANLHRLRNPGQGEVYQPGLVQAVGLRHASFVDCEIANTGGHAIWLAAGSSHNLIQRCHLHDLAGGGVYIGGGWGINDNFPAGHNTVDNCFIHDGSYQFRGAHGVWIGKSSHNTVTHNEISNFDYSGISCGWSWGFQPSSANHNTLDFNYIHHLGNGDGLGDMGAIYTLGVSPGTTIRHNHIHDVYNYAHVSHGSGIYPDEGSTEILIEHNVVYRVRTSPLFMHYGMECTVRNNILALGGAGQLRRSREDKRCHYIAEGNIVYGGENTRMLDGPWRNGDWQLGRNVYWSSGGQPDFAGMDFAAWQVHGKDVGSIVADPLFVDPANGDFRLRPESPALAMGFQPIDVSRAGLYGEAAWTTLPGRYPNRVRNEIERPVEPPFQVHFDFEAEEPEGQPLHGTVVPGEHGAGVSIAADHAASGKHSLKFTDAPDQRYAWTPHIYYRPTYTEGAVRLSWDMRNSPEAPASFFVELRQYDAGAPFLTGPSVSVDAAGTVTSRGQTIGAMPLGEWVNLTIDLNLDPAVARPYVLTLNVPGQPPVVRELTYPSAGFRQIDWLGIASTSEQQAVFHIDNLMLGTAEELAQTPRRRPAPPEQARARRLLTQPPNDQMLSGHWSFDQLDGYTVPDQSGWGNDGELWARLVTGEFGTALLCDAASTHVTIEDDASLAFGTGDFAVELWLSPTQLAVHLSDPRRRILSKNDHPRTWWVLDVTSEGRIRLEMADANKVARTSQTQGAVAEGAWSHVAAVVDRANRQVRLYLNGALDSSHGLPADFSGALDVPADLTLGSTWQPFLGLLDEVRIYRRTLSAEEIRASYERERPRRGNAAYRLVE